MKKLIFAVALSFSAFMFAQKQPIRNIYPYTAVNNAQLVKAKTDLFILNVIAAGIQMNKNSVGNDHIDLNMLMPYKDGKISSRIRYDFLKEGYVVSLSHTKLLPTKGKEILINNDADPNHKKILDSIQKLIFDAYQKELNK